MPSDERALATWLSARDDAALAGLLHSRAVSPSAPWRDFFDAAEALLDPASIDRALVHLPRPALVALAGGSAARATEALLTHLALRDDAGSVYAAVGERITALRDAHPSAFAAWTDLADPARSDEEQSAHAAERVFTTSGALADVLLISLTAPLSRTGAGAVTAIERRRMLEAGAVGSAQELDDLVDLAAGAALITPAGREWIVTPRGRDWLNDSTLRRWGTVAECWRSALPDGLRTSDAGWLPPDLWPTAYPLDAQWPTTAQRLRRIAERWGLIGPAGDEPAWASALRLGGSADATALAPHLPAEIDRVYLQADLSAIAPGPLAPGLDMRLRRIAVRESRAQASTYRFTAESLAAGMTEGETAESVRAFLQGISLTGIPQPLDYLIDSTAARHGLVRVATDPASGRTRVDSDDPALLDALEVDQALRSLGLVDDGPGLSTRVDRDAVYWSLADARYPVVAVDHDGDTQPLHRRTAASDTVESAGPLETYAALIAGLRDGHAGDGDDAWLQRELEQAVRTRSGIVVTVRMPDGAERAFTLEANGLGGGRLRGRDRAADIERTLPVSSIVGIRPA